MKQSQLRMVRGFTMVGLAALALVIVSCTRSRSTEVAPGETPAVDQDATFQAVLAATQTAIAQAPPETGGGDELTATPLPPTVVAQAPTATPAPPTPISPSPTAVPPTGPIQYTVKQGDWLYKIAREHGVDPQAVIAANPGINPNLLQPGQVLTIPAAGSPPPGTGGGGGPTTYTVQQGEWIYQIARKLGEDPQAIIAANPGINPNLLYPGQVINIP